MLFHRAFMRCSSVVLIMLLAAAEFGCSVQVPLTQTVAPSDPIMEHPLPFKGRLVSGNANQLPPAIAMSL